MVWCFALKSQDRMPSQTIIPCKEREDGEVWTAANIVPLLWRNDEVRVREVSSEDFLPNII
jgi:hypothetical protein